MIPLPVKVRSLNKYLIHIEFADGTKGDVDLSHMAQHGVFRDWDKNNLFSKVHVNKETYAVSWNEELEICADSLYLKLKGLTFEEWKSKQKTHATN